MEQIVNTPAQFADFVKAELVKWARVVKAAGVTADCLSGLSRLNAVS